MREFLRTTAMLGIALLLSSITAAAQDDAYITPAKAKTKYEKKKERIKEQRRSDYRPYEYTRPTNNSKSEYENMVDLYNRRGKLVTVSDMPEDTIVVAADDVQQTIGVRSSLGSRLGYGSNANTIVLPNVDRVIVLDDMNYDAWSDTYYGRDAYTNSFVTINNSPLASSYMDFYRGYYPWRGFYSAWDYPWSYYSSRWYRPWYGWGYHRYAWSWSYYDPWDYYYGHPYYHHHGYHHGYYDGYYDGAYSSSRKRYTPNSYGRSAGRYYDRNATTSAYGGVMGRDNAYQRSRGNSFNYNSSSYGNSGYNQRNSSVNSGWTNRDSYSSPSRSSSSSYGNSSSRSSSPSRSTGGGGNSGGTSRVRR